MTTPTSTEPQAAIEPPPPPTEAPPANPLPEGVTYGTLFPRMEFPELTPPGCDMVWVEIRNPGMMPPVALEEARAGMKDIETNEDGSPVDEQAAAPAVYMMLSKMIRKWHVYDVMADDDPLPLLASPPRTAEVIKQAPSAILNRIMEVVQALQVPR
ncbi:hypothetical protein QMK19_03710 [Streptomyces sp. H10-C2]|uniref:hypothetical protein n=1 Tax=unclassified Streptomyces TaxID=2593676 RepID=UPI0024BB8980|nr:MULTISPECIES: hypothetical protein [unclassified Streptomyces]MDJ0342294.1 hypothetical protein [Streptomyces sp. PH10-H1]MDJ0368808.1 hypothetical protein [Streptomyces sp. H10-C2]